MHIVCYFYINVKLTHNSESELHQEQSQTQLIVTERLHAGGFADRLMY